MTQIIAKAYGLGTLAYNEDTKKLERTAPDHLQDITVYCKNTGGWLVEFNAMNNTGTPYTERIHVNENPGISEIPTGSNLERNLFSRLRDVSLGPVVHKALEALERDYLDRENVVSNSGKDYFLFSVDPSGQPVLF